MNKVEIKDKTALIKIFKTISWLDSIRWENDNNYNFVYFSSNLTNSEKILTHWICYITDRQMSFEKVWQDGGSVFSELVSDYSTKNILSPKEILDNHYKKDMKNKFKFTSATNEFASRFVTVDYKNILQTLEFLDNHRHRRNIILYIVDILRKFKTEADLLTRVACGLYLLTYQLKSNKTNPENAITILNDNNKFERKLTEFKKSSTKNKKRLWCCIRDYKKGLYHKIFNEAVMENFSDIEAKELIESWEKLAMEHLELPGDVWNNNPMFRNKLFGKVIDFKDVKKPNMAEIIRELYNEMKGNNEIIDFYPEQFDITFDFVPRMCSMKLKKICNVCLFGNKGIELICIPSKDKYCPVALFSCGYIYGCIGNNCILKTNLSSGICVGF